MSWNDVHCKRFDCKRVSAGRLRFASYERKFSCTFSSCSSSTCSALPHVGNVRKPRQQIRRLITAATKFLQFPFSPHVSNSIQPNYTTIGQITVICLFTSQLSDPDSSISIYYSFFKMIYWSSLNRNGNPVSSISNHSTWFTNYLLQLNIYQTMFNVLKAKWQPRFLQFKSPHSIGFIIHILKWYIGRL